MFETNTAACGGFPGISDSFGAGLWAVDWALKLSTYNFSATLFHVGGQGDYYNPFTPPPTNQSNFRQWTTGSVYYSTLIVAELFDGILARVAYIKKRPGGCCCFSKSGLTMTDDVGSRPDISGKI